MPSTDTIISLVLEMIPLGLGAAVSPTLLSVAIIILSSKNHPKFQTLSYLAGAALAMIVLFFIFWGGGATVGTGTRSLPSAILDVAIGGLLIFAGVRKVLKKPKPKPEKSEQRPVNGRLGSLLARDAVLGIIMTVTNFSSIVFIAAAARETARANIDFYQKMPGVAIMIFFYLLPITLPLSLTLIAPSASDRTLTSLNSFLKKYGRYVLAAIAIGFGVVLAVRGLGVFL